MAQFAHQCFSHLFLGFLLILLSTDYFSPLKYSGYSYSLTKFKYLQIVILFVVKIISRDINKSIYFIYNFYVNLVFSGKFSNLKSFGAAHLTNLMAGMLFDHKIKKFTNKRKKSIVSQLQYYNTLLVFRGYVIQVCFYMRIFYSLILLKNNGFTKVLEVIKYLEFLKSLMFRVYQTRGIFGGYIMQDPKCLFLVM